MRRIFKLPATAAKTSLYLLTAAGAGALASQTISPTLVPGEIRAGISGIVRSSRAVWTIASTVVDYKYSLHGLSEDSDDYRRVLSEVHLCSAKRILQLCEANKGFYVKAGQFVAALRQVPKEYSSTLSSLQDQAVPCHFKAIKEVLTSSLGPDLLEIFLSFDEHPVAAASIAQVHRAVLKDHQEVAVKVGQLCNVISVRVQYPGLEHQFKIDIAAMSFLSKFVALFFPEYRFGWLVSEFAESVALELDFIHEARNAERTARNFKNNTVVRVPHIFWDFTTRRVLTMEFCQGCKLKYGGGCFRHASSTPDYQKFLSFQVDDLEFMIEMEIEPIKVAKALVEVFAEMIFVHGFVHGDPHPGNILVSPEGPNSFCLVLLDHGIYKELDEGFRRDYCQLWKALILLDANKILQLGERFGVGKYSRYFPLIFTGRTIDSKSALGRGMSAEERKNIKQDLQSLKMEDLSSFMESLPSDFLMILRTDGLLRSLLSKLGAPHRVRLLAYAKYAIQGLSPKSNPESELLELLSWTEQVWHSLIKLLKQILVPAGYRLRNLSPFYSLTP
ncbi:hypothetical protein RHGRI_030245 [Rhododendron griersonianum]|uniref:ABC1 atypical kinase-like domain-containing protein n=1 Tax=Rhododendron griersonianum TaxID=479676 RepID=A0AAV6IQR6_9ERIC|nr:hypothetical protein RHGRI_030245 [Rhododendron griersonianum]